MVGNDRERELMDDEEAVETVCRLGREFELEPEDQAPRVVPGAGVQKVPDHAVSVPARKLPRRWVVWCRWVKCIPGGPWQQWRRHGRYETLPRAETALEHLRRVKGDSWEFCLNKGMKPND